MNDTEFQHIAPRLRQVALQASRNCGADSMQADDAAQEVMLRLWQMRSELGKYRSVEAVAARIARNVFVDQCRKPSSLSLSAQRQQIATDHATPEQLLEHKEAEQWLEKRLKALPSTQYAILQMRQVEHKSTAEIARLLSIEETSVRSLLSRARHTMLQEIRKWESRG